MIQIERTSVMNFENAMRGARNPLNSWNRMDSHTEPDGAFCVRGKRPRPREALLRGRQRPPQVYPADFRLCRSDGAAVLGGRSSTPTRSAPPQIRRARCTRSTRSPSAADFSCERMLPEARESLEGTIAALEALRLRYLETKDKAVWYSIIQLLPSSYNQMRTCTMTYENLVSMYFARRHHKLDEWHDYCAWIESLPYFKALFLENEAEK